MYEYIKGIFVCIAADYVVVENNGIGYKIFTSGNTIASLPQRGEGVKLFLKQIVREDFIGLYGFLTEEELEMFNVLLTINGVGAKAALSLLSIASVEKLKRAIVNGDESVITKAQGVGKKTAQRIILEVKDKIYITKGEESENGDIDNNDSQEESNRISEAFSALISLGYSEKEAEKAIKSADTSKAVEDIIKNCLQILMN